MKRGRPPHPDILTPQQWRVLELLRQGLTNEQIASRMGLTLDGAKYHVSEILTKLGVANRDEAAAWRPEPTVRRSYLLAPLAWLTAGGPMRAVVATSAVAAIVVMTALLVFTSPGDRTQELGKVAYLVDGDLWVKELPHGQPKRLTDGGAVVRPKWSPSGEWIMYQRTPPAPGDEFGIWVIRADGTGRRQVVVQGLASWSPIADVLVYAEPSGPMSLGADVLVAENADGSGRRELLPAMPGGGTLDRRLTPVWSSDGRWIVFIEHHQDHDSPTGGYSYIGLRAVRDDGTDEHEIFSGELDAQFGLKGPVPLLFAVTGGETPASLSLTPSAPPQPVDAAGVPLGVAVAPLTGRDPSLDGNAVQLLTHRDYVDLSPGGDVLAFVAGVDLATPPAPPDGRTILPAIDTGTRKAMAVLDLQTMALRTLTPRDVVAVSPAWSPDGNDIAYVARPDIGPVHLFGDRAAVESPRRIWRIGADGAAARPIASNQPTCRQERPLWSAGGGHILFACIDGEVVSLWLVPSKGGTAVQVVSSISAGGTLGRPGQQLFGSPDHIDWEYLYDWWRP